MEGHAKKCLERSCELANKTTQQFYKVSISCFDDHHFKEEEMKSVGELSHVCSEIVLHCLYLARIGRTDVLRSVNKVARSITEWTIHVKTNNISLWVILQHNAGSDCLKTDFAGDLEDPESTAGGTLCVFGSVIHLFREFGCVRNKLQFHTVHQNRKSFLWMQDVGYMVFPLLTCGI